MLEAVSRWSVVMLLLTLAGAVALIAWVLWFRIPNAWPLGFFAAAGAALLVRFAWAARRPAFWERMAA